MEGGFIFHIGTDTLKLTITPPDAKLEAKRAAKAEAKLVAKMVIADDFKAKKQDRKPTLLDTQNAKLVAAAQKAAVKA